MELEDEAREVATTGCRARVLIASDKYKGTLTSADVALALAQGLRQSAPEIQTTMLLVADGGDGSLEVALARGARSLTLTADDVEGTPQQVEICLEGNRAFIEVAKICGLGARHPDGAAALRGTSRGVGQAILAALDLGANQIVLASGGSATSDGGSGMLNALGLRLLDEARRPIAPGGGGLLGLAAIDPSGLDGRLAGLDLILACDVDNPLLGPNGAATIYGPQKGAAAEDVAKLEHGMARWVDIACAARLCRPGLAESPGAGAAGGLGFAALLLGGRMVAGADYFLDLAGLNQEIRNADLVITGEGRLDEQSLRGKAPSIVAARARDAGVPVHAVVGACSLTADRWRDAGFTAVDTLTDLDSRCANDEELSRKLLRDIGRRIAANLTNTSSMPTK